VSCTRAKQASKPRLGLPSVQLRRGPKLRRKLGSARLVVLGKPGGSSSASGNAGLALSTPRPGLDPSANRASAKGHRSTKPSPQPSKPTAHHQPALKALGAKAPRPAASQARAATKAGKVGSSRVAAKRGGTAKSAKLQLAKPRLATAPARQARRTASAPRPAAAHAQPGPTGPSAATATASPPASAAEDDDPGIGPAGAPAGGDHDDPAQVAAPQAHDIPPAGAEVSVSAHHRAHSPVPSCPHARPRVSGRGLGRSIISSASHAPSGGRHRDSFVRTLHPREQA
jgi:hypothetical protein